MGFNRSLIGWRVKTDNFHQGQILQIIANMAITCVLKVFATNSFETIVLYKVFGGILKGVCYNSIFNIKKTILEIKKYTSHSLFIFCQ